MDELVARVEELARRHDRVVIGVAGPPGTGKSTLVEAFATALVGRGWQVAVVPMDGFHLADVELARLGRQARKGAIDTFDGHGFLALLRRLHAERSSAVYAPAFDRRIEEPVAGAIVVEPGVRVVLTEGNYLLDDSPPWTDVRRQLTEAWYVDVDDAVRRQRLVARHVRYGKDPDAARRWVEDVDEVNARRVARHRGTADLVVSAVDQAPVLRSRSAREVR